MHCYSTDPRYTVGVVSLVHTPDLHVALSGPESLHWCNISPGNAVLAGAKDSLVSFRITIFVAICGSDFRDNLITLTRLFKQAKQIRIPFMAMFKVNTCPPNEVH